MLNPNIKLQLHSIGNGGFPLLVLDDFLADPEAMIQTAVECKGFEEDASDFYPGLRCPLPGDMSEQITHQLKDILAKQLPQPNVSIECLFHAFSLTITPQEQLKPIQCIPHFDDDNPNKLAMVLYLFKEDLGGTSFYRHNKTGYEAITPQNSKHYMNTLMSQATTEGLPEAAYIKGNSQLFSRIHSVEAKFNRCILYPSNILHSGDINTEKGLSADPQVGRLTVNMGLVVA